MSEKIDAILDWLGCFWDREEHRLYFAHSAMFIQPPIWLDIGQAKIALGITCPRHRAIWKHKLGWFGRWIPDLEWDADETKLVNVWRRGGKA